MARGQDVRRNASYEDTAKSGLLWFRSTLVASQRRTISCLVLVFLLSTFVGCSRCRLPAIDPTGNRLFSGSLTQLTLPSVHASPENVGIVPSPSFREPPPPPACLTGPTIVPNAQPVGPKLLHGHQMDDRGRCGQLLMTPTRIVAPVNGDVVVMSGICGEDGYLVTGEPIEWMIAPQSVGQIIEVGDDGTGSQRRLVGRNNKPAVEKLGVDFARGVTSSVERVITRGSARPTDDLLIRKGQTWVSLTSPVEGITRLTALAPDAEVWDKRRQTATIYWVDAKWQFHPPVPDPTGNTQTLTTKVTRSEGLAPAEGWIVRYKSQDSKVVVFAPTNSANAEVVVDRSGKASVQLANPTGKPGMGVVTIEVVRPAQATENMPELTLATDQTVVSWNAADLLLNCSGPGTAAVNQTVSYTANLSNMGNVTSENTRLSLTIPSGMQYVGARPEPNQKSTNAIAWDIGAFPAQNQFDVSVDLRPMADADYRVDFSAGNSGGVFLQRAVATLVASPKISVEIRPVPGNEQAEVGKIVELEVAVTNRGNTAMNNLSVVVESDPGLQSVNNQNSNVTTVNRTIPYLGPGESRTIPGQFIVRQVGNLNATAFVELNGARLAQQTTSVVGVEAIQRVPGLAVQLAPASGTNAVAAGSRTLVGLTVSNNGQVALSNVQVVIAYSGSLEPMSASPGRQPNLAQRQVLWQIPSLDVGGKLTFSVDFAYNGNEPVPRIVGMAMTAPQVRAEATLDLQGTSGADSAMPPGNTGVVPPSGALPPSTNNDPASALPPTNAGNAMPPSNAAGGLGVSLEPVRQQVRLNNDASYVLKISNNRATADQNVRAVIQLPQGLELRAVTFGDGRTASYNFLSGSSAVELEPIRFIRPNETVQYNITIGHRVTGSVNIRATVSSSLSPQGVESVSNAIVAP